MIRLLCAMIATLYLVLALLAAQDRELMPDWRARAGTAAGFGAIGGGAGLFWWLA